MAFVTDPLAAQVATAQLKSPFVLVNGLTLIGLVADAEGLFAALGDRLAEPVPNGIVLFAGAVVVVVAVVTAVLNLDTSVVFVSPGRS